MPAQTANLLKPPAVIPGAGVTVIAPASFAQPDRVQRGLQSLNALGFDARLGASALERGPLYFAGTDAQRLADLHAAFADETTSAVMCLRGGYGSGYLLGDMDLESHPQASQAVLCL